MHSPAPSAPSAQATPSAASSPIGVFDSGIGGLSVLRALQAQLPSERFVYLADSRYAPYGERGADFVMQRTVAIADYLVRTRHIKALVVACNTATAAAIALLRGMYPHMVLVGVEPALKPAVALSRTGRIGVMGTRGTLGSTKFARLLASVQGQARFVLQPCDGLAYAIERTALDDCSTGCSVGALGATPAWEQVRVLCQRYTDALGRFGGQAGEIDTLVLGCTHYVFAHGALSALVGPQVQLLETGESVARQTQRLLTHNHSLSTYTAQNAADDPAHGGAASVPMLELLTTGQVDMLHSGAMRWLQRHVVHGCHVVDI